MGRWLSRDPIEERGGLSLYGFVGNKPIDYWDYLGWETIVFISDDTAWGDKFLWSVMGCCYDPEGVEIREIGSRWDFFKVLIEQYLKKRGKIDHFVLSGHANFCCEDMGLPIDQRGWSGIGMRFKKGNLDLEDITPFEAFLIRQLLSDKADVLVTSCWANHHASSEDIGRVLDVLKVPLQLSRGEVPPGPPTAIGDLFTWLNALLRKPTSPFDWSDIPGSVSNPDFWRWFWEWWRKGSTGWPWMIYEPYRDF